MTSQRVRVVFASTIQPNPDRSSRHKKVSKVTVTFGPLVMAHATLPGTWNSGQAEAEYKKNPTKFTHTDNGERYKHLL